MKYFECRHKVKINILTELSFYSMKKKVDRYRIGHRDQFENLYSKSLTEISNYLLIGKGNKLEKRSYVLSRRELQLPNQCKMVNHFKY